MSTLRTWLLETDPVLLFFSIFIVVWLGAIIYYIPVRLYLDGKALEAEQRSAVPRERAEDLKTKRD